MINERNNLTASPRNLFRVTTSRKIAIMDGNYDVKGAGKWDQYPATCLRELDDLTQVDRQCD